MECALGETVGPAQRTAERGEPRIVRGREELAQRVDRPRVREIRGEERRPQTLLKHLGQQVEDERLVDGRRGGVRGERPIPTAHELLRALCERWAATDSG